MLLTTTTTFHGWRHQLNARKSRKASGKHVPHINLLFSKLGKEHFPGAAQAQAQVAGQAFLVLTAITPFLMPLFWVLHTQLGPALVLKTLGFATRHLWPRANACFSYCPVANTQYPTYFAKVRLLVFVFSAFETPKVQWSQTCPFICYLAASTWETQRPIWVHRVSVCDIWVYHICMILVLCEVHPQKCKLLHFWKRPSYEIAIFM